MSIRIIKTLTFLGLSVVLSTGVIWQSHAALVFTTEDNGVHDQVFYIDSGDTSSDFIDLEFGTAVDAKLRYDVINDNFIFNRDVNFSGNVVEDVRVENLATPPTCDAGSIGRIYFNTTDVLSYVCDGTTFNPLENVLGATVEFPVVQARRTSTYTLTTAFADIDLDTTDLENDTVSLDHDDTLRDRINIGETAMYQIIYGYTAGGTATGTHEARARVRVNDTTVLPGSESVNRNYQVEFSTTSASFLANLTAGDFISLQLNRDATADSTQDDIYFSIVKLEGIKGDKGDKGDPGIPGSAGIGTDENTFILDQDDTGGDVKLQFGATLDESLTWNSAQTRFDLSNTLRTLGNLEQDGNVLTLDAENAGAGADVDIVANQGSDNDGTLRYNATLNQWEISNDGGAFEPISVLTSNIAQVYQSGTTTFNAATPITWDGTSTTFRVIDSQYAHSTTANPSRVTVNADGIYEVNYSIAWDTTANARRTATCAFFVNGSAVTPTVGTSHDYSRNNNDDFGSNSSSFFYDFTAGDYYEIYCQSTGTAGSITTLANQSSTSIKLIR